MIKIKLGIVALVSVILTGFIGTTKVDAVTTQENKELSAYKVVETLKNVAELEIPYENITNDYGKYISKSDTQTVTMNKDNEIEFISSGNNRIEAGVSYEMDTDDSYTKKIDNVIVMENDSEDYFITTEVFDGGLRNCFIIDKKCEEESFQLKLDLPQGSYLEFSKDEYNDNKMDGSILIMKDEDTIIGAIGIPWAKDADGNEVETYYEISGDKIIQHVKHLGRNVKYPIVADPVISFKSCFKSGKWITRKGVVSLSLKPNATLRASMITGSSSMRKYSWNSVKSKFSSSKKWKNTTSMKNQYECHWYFASYKSEFNLEPSRPTTTWANMVAKLCNP